MKDKLDSIHGLDGEDNEESLPKELEEIFGDLEPDQRKFVKQTMISSFRMGGMI